MKKQTVFASVLITGLGLAAVAATVMSSSTFAMSGRPSSGVTPTSDRYKCFDTTFVRNFVSVDDHTIVIVSDENQAYELKLGGPCIGLDTSFAIGVRARTGMTEVCDAFDADILYSDMGRERVQECPVTGVRHLMGNDAAPYVMAHHDKRGAAASSSQ